MSQRQPLHTIVRTRRVASSIGPAVACAVVLGLPVANATAAAPRHEIHAGFGWQNTGASRRFTWEPAIAGSRKDVPVIAGWSLVGNGRVHWAPFARVKYTNAWSIGGAVNLLGVDLGFGGLGVYLTQPPAAVERTTGRWFATLTINLANLRLGGNVTPNRPKNDRIPDPDTHREQVREQVARGGETDHTLQRYPFGRYAYAELAFPIQIRAWKQVREDLGVGFFFEAVPFGFEWSLDRRVARFAQTYTVLVGPSITLGRGAPRKPRPGSAVARGPSSREAKRNAAVAGAEPARVRS
jgi:hypothetical protein